MAELLAIETTDLWKRYPGADALRGLDLTVPRGSITGFLGRNGAGKTTTLKILLGIAHATSGDARVFGLPVSDPANGVDIRRRTGFVTEEKDLIGYMTVEDIVRFTAAFFPRWRCDLQQTYLKTFSLPLSQKVKTLSRGTRTKLALLLALCRGAELLVLDEPTSGLDPAVTEEVLQALVRHTAAEETTVFFSSHQIAEVDQIADRIAIVGGGRTLLSGALDDLRQQYCRVQLVFDGEAPDPAFRAPGVRRVRREGRVLTVLSSSGADPIVAEARALAPRSVDIVPVTLKEIFLETAGAED